MAELTLQGKRFKPVKNSTFEHDCWLIRKQNESGIGNIQMFEGETPSQLAHRYTQEAFSSPKVMELFGGLIMPADIAPEMWTPEMAVETTQYIKGITDPDSKRLMFSQVAALVADFFLSGVSALKISRKYSGEAQAPASESAAS